MAQVANSLSERMSIRLNIEDKQLLLKAVALTHTNITEFVLQRILPSAKQIVQEHEQKQLSARDLRLMLDMLDNPPAENARLLKAREQARLSYQGGQNAH